MPARRSLRTRNALTTNRSPPAPAPAASRRPRRTASGLGEQVTIARESSNSPESGQKGIRLTVKMPSNKLREATSHGRRSAPDGLEPAVIISGPRSNRGKKSYVVESETDEEEEEVEDTEEDIPLEDQVGEPEATDDDIDAEENQDEEEEEEQDQAADEDEGESGEGDGDEDEDVEMEDESPMPPPPVMKLTGPTSKPSVTVTPAKNVKLKSVEAKEMEMEDDDEDLSSISEGEEDAEGEDVGEGDELDLDDEGDIQSTGIGSRASTPDVSKMTKRQKSRLSEVMSRDDFLQLPMGKSPQYTQSALGGPRLTHRSLICNASTHSLVTNQNVRATNQEASHSGRTRHAPCRDGTSPQEPE